MKNVYALRHKSIKNVFTCGFPVKKNYSNPALYTDMSACFLLRFPDVTQTWVGTRERQSTEKPSVSCEVLPVV